MDSRAQRYCGSYFDVSEGSTRNGQVTCKFLDLAPRPNLYRCLGRSQMMMRTLRQYTCRYTCLYTCLYTGPYSGPYTCPVYDDDADDDDT